MHKSSEKMRVNGVWQVFSPKTKHHKRLFQSSFWHKALYSSSGEGENLFPHPSKSVRATPSETVFWGPENWRALNELKGAIDSKLSIIGSQTGR